MSAPNLPPLPVEPIPRLALRPAEAAESLGVSARTMADWIKAGDIPYVRRGGCVLLPVADVRRWLGEQTQAHNNKEGAKHDEQPQSR